MKTIRNEFEKNPFQFLFQLTQFGILIFTLVGMGLKIHWDVSHLKRELIDVDAKIIKVDDKLDAFILKQIFRDESNYFIKRENPYG